MTGPALRIEIRGLDALTRRFGPRNVHTALVRAMEAATAHVEGEIKERTPVNKESTPGQLRGQLAASWTNRVVSLIGDIKGIIGTRVHYGPYVEEGTGIYVGRDRIRPARAQALRFFWHGRWHFRTSVAGQKGQHMAKRGLEEGRTGAARIIERRLTDYLNTGRSR